MDNSASIMQMADMQAATAAMQQASKGAQSAGAAAVQDKKIRETAENFEAVFLGQMLKPMFETVASDGLMGGGNAESIYKGMMAEEMGRSIAKNGGVGIADQVYREMLKMQEL